MRIEMSDSDAASAIAGLLLKLRARDLLSGEDEEVLRACVSEIREFPAGRTIVRTGTTLGASTLLVEGIVCRYKDLADGQRQIMELHVAGDFVDLHGLLLKQLDHNVGTMTPVRVASFPHDALRGITETHPHLGRMLWFSTLLDAAIHREKILSVGRRSALARIAHILCELFVRLKVVGLAEDHTCDLPITQGEFADATGLTPVHVNRVFQELRADGLIQSKGTQLTIPDWDKLKAAGEFDPTYLHLQQAAA